MNVVCCSRDWPFKGLNNNNNNKIIKIYHVPEYLLNLLNLKFNHIIIACFGIVLSRLSMYIAECVRTPSPSSRIRRVIQRIKLIIVS